MAARGSAVRTNAVRAQYGLQGAALATNLTSASVIVVDLFVSSPLTASLSIIPTITADLGDYVGPSAALQSRLSCATTISAILTRGVLFSTGITNSAVIAAALTTQIKLASSTQTQAAITAALATQIKLAAHFNTQPAITTDLSTQIQLAASIYSAASIRAYIRVPLPENLQQVYLFTPPQEAVCYGFR